MSFDIPNGNALNPNGYFAGTRHGKLNGNSHLTNGHIESNGYTSRNDQSVNRDYYGSESSSQPSENSAAEPIAIIGMGSLIHFLQYQDYY